MSKHYWMAAAIGAAGFFGGTSAQAATYTVSDVIHDFHGYGGGYTNDKHLIVNNAWQMPGYAPFEGLFFLKFDLSSVVASGFDVAAGDTALLSLTKYTRDGLSTSTDANPIRIGISALNTVDVASVTDSGGLALAAADLGTGAQPALTATVAEAWVGNDGVYTFDISSLVQQWLDDPSANLGVAVHARNDFSAGPGLANPHFVSSEGPNPGAQHWRAEGGVGPQLILNVAGNATVVPTPASAGLLVLGLTALVVRRRRMA